MKIFIVLICLSFILINISFVSFFITVINTSIEIKMQNDFQISDLVKINNAVSKAGFRNINTNPLFFDDYIKQFYNKLKFKKSFLKEYPDLKNIFYLKKYYLTTDNTDGPTKVVKKIINDYFNDFLLNKERSKVYTSPENLNLARRIIVDDKGKPVCFYEVCFYHIYNLFGDRETDKEILINFENDNDDLSILGFAGDFVIEEFVKYSINNIGLKYCLDDVDKILSTPDIMSVNLEFTITDREVKEPKSFNFKADKNYYRLLIDSPIDIVSCANNHAMDYGIESILDTIRILDKFGVYHSGSGKDMFSAFDPVRLIKKNNYFSFFSICDVPDEREYKVMKIIKADINKPGVAYYDEKILADILSVESKSGFLNIIQLHGGEEFHEEPTNKLIYQSKKLIDLGADAVICHHPHVVNGIEIYKDKIIAYSLGNFLLDIQNKKNADEGIILFLYVLNNKIVCWSFLPVYSEYAAVKIDDGRCREIERRFLTLTKKLSYLSNNKK